MQSLVGYARRGLGLAIRRRAQQAGSSSRAGLPPRWRSMVTAAPGMGGGTKTCSEA